MIYGWTSHNEATSLSKDKRNVIVVVREIEVTAPNGKTRTFTPSADNMAEAILHEIAIHAGRIAQGLPDTHDETSAVIRELVDRDRRLLPDGGRRRRARAQPAHHGDPRLRGCSN